MDEVKDRWKMGPNAYATEPQGDLDAPAWPKTPQDLVLSRSFLSVNPQEPNYLRIAADGPLATGGAGGGLSNYFGACPPGPAPAEGDWFTRLQDASKAKE